MTVARRDPPLIPRQLSSPPTPTTSASILAVPVHAPAEAIRPVTPAIDRAWILVIDGGAAARRGQLLDRGAVDGQVHAAFVQPGHVRGLHEPPPAAQTALGSQGVDIARIKTSARRCMGFPSLR